MEIPSVTVNMSTRQRNVAQCSRFFPLVVLLLLFFHMVPLFVSALCNNGIGRGFSLLPVLACLCAVQLTIRLWYL